MTDIKVETVEKNFDTILETVGTESFVNWDKFSSSSSGVINAIDELNKKMIKFREYQHRNFIQTMKKLKSLDLPDLISAVKAKKLPKEALRSVLTRFKAGEGEKIELAEPIDTLKSNATKEFEDYLNKNESFLEELKKFEAFIEKRIADFGFEPEQPSEPFIKATVKFNLSEEQAEKIANDIKIEYVPGTSYITLKSYSDIVNGCFPLIKEEHARITKEARVAQRENISDDAKYLKIMNDYLMNGEALIIEGQKLLAKKLGLAETKLEESEIFLMERGLSQHMLVLQSQLRGKVKESVPPTKEVAFDLAKEIITFQTKMIKEKEDIIKRILSNVPKTQESIQTIPMLLALILNDMVFHKYAVEEEDFMKNVSEEIIATSPELSTIFKDMELAIIKLMQYIGIIPEEVGKAMEQNALLQGQQGQQGGNPGIMSGVSPMDMLQMQQMQQLKQMQGGKGAVV